MASGEAEAEIGSRESSEIETTPTADQQTCETVQFIEPIGMTRSQAFNLYTSHFLSTWNVRTYEFAAIIFTANVYPNTLIAAAIRGIVRTCASICFSSMVGRWVDQSPDRLRTLLSTISVNRFAVIAASAFWLLIVEPNNSISERVNLEPYIVAVSLSSMTRGAIFASILILGIFENLSASGNMFSMERDWIITAASPGGLPYDLTHLNAIMRRIDLVCKLIAPIIISIIVSATSTRTGVFVVGGMSTISWIIETLCARNVCNRNPKLQAPKLVEAESESVPDFLSQTFRSQISEGLRRYFRDFKHYFSSKVWTPSLALALLHLSALAYSATFITFLLNVGFSLDLITVARAAGSVVEISSTIVTPFGVQYLGKTPNHGRFHGEVRMSEDSETILLENESPDVEGRTETGLERLGLWGISWQLLNLVSSFGKITVRSNADFLGPRCSCSVVTFIRKRISKLDTTSYSRLLGPVSSQKLLAFVIFFFLSISRLGLWIYDLTTQQLTQTMTTPSQRSSFTGVEYSFVSLFELGQYIITIILHRPEQFKWIALMSWTAVAIGTVAYAAWVWKMRGHLIHWERLGKSCECIKIRHDQ